MEENFLNLDSSRYRTYGIVEKIGSSTDLLINLLLFPEDQFRMEFGSISDSWSNWDELITCPRSTHIGSNKQSTDLSRAVDGWIFGTYGMGIGPNWQQVTSNVSCLSQRPSTGLIGIIEQLPYRSR